MSNECFWYISLRYYNRLKLFGAPNCLLYGSSTHMSLFA